MLPFVMTAHDIHSPGFPQRIQFIDKDDAGGLAGGLSEKVANAGSADPDKHLHKLRAADAEKRHSRLPGNGPGQKGFSGPRRADQKHPFGYPSPQFLEFPRIAQKFNDLLKLFFGFIDAGCIGKINLRLTFGKNFGLALAERHHPHPRPHPFHGEAPDQEKNTNWDDPGKNAA